MSSFNKNKTDAYAPVDLSLDKLQQNKDTHFDRSGYFLDTTEFKMDPQVATQIGLTAARTKEDKRLFDTEVLKFVQSIKDDAYSDAYKLGREEGIKVAKEEALVLAKEDINSRLQSLLLMIQGLENYRQKMYEQNETEIIRFCYIIAEKILLKEVKQNKEYVLEIIKKMIPEDQSSGVRLSANDHIFIQSHLPLLEKELNIQSIKFEPDETLRDGDVIVETANGTLDGTLATRLEKLKRSLEQME